MARVLEGLAAVEADFKAVDQAMAEAGKWAKEVATFRHARIAAIKLAGDPNDKALGELTLDQLKQGIMADLEKLADVIDLKALLPAKSLRHRPLTNQHNSALD